MSQEANQVDTQYNIEFNSSHGEGNLTKFLKERENNNEDLKNIVTPIPEKDCSTPVKIYSKQRVSTLYSHRTHQSQKLQQIEVGEVEVSPMKEVQQAMVVNEMSPIREKASPVREKIQVLD